MIGTSLGNYEILSPLGKGGEAEPWMSVRMNRDSYIPSKAECQADFTSSPLVCRNR